MVGSSSTKALCSCCMEVSGNNRLWCSRSLNRRGGRINEYSNQGKETVLILCRRQWFDEVGCNKEGEVDAVSSSKDDEF